MKADLFIYIKCCFLTRSRIACGHVLSSDSTSPHCFYANLFHVQITQLYIIQMSPSPPEWIRQPRILASNASPSKGGFKSEETSPN